METSETRKDDSMTAIERALAAAKARKAQRDAAYSGSDNRPSSPPVAPKPSPSRPSAEEREAEKKRRDEERAARESAKAQKSGADEEAKLARKAERDAAKAAKRALKEAEKNAKKPAHMKKVDKARSKCPALNDVAEQIFGEATANLTAQQIDALAQHLLVHNRAAATIRATQLDPLPLGAQVRITGGDPRFVGMTGEVVHAQKLRAKVAVPGVKKEVYIYNGQAIIIQEDANAVVAL